MGSFILILLICVSTVVGKAAKFEVNQVIQKNYAIKSTESTTTTPTTTSNPLTVGCEYDGKSYSPGSVRKNPDLEYCTCSDYGTWICSEWGLCSVACDHIKTFDGTWFTANGNCMETLIQNCGYTTDNYKLQIQNTNGSCCEISDLYLEIKNTTYKLSAQQGTKPKVVKYENVNDETPISLPYTDSKVSIIQEGYMIHIFTTNGISIICDMNYTVLVMVDGSHANNICGLCGTFDKDQDNEAEMGTCLDSTPVPPCTNSSVKHECSILNDAIFSGCHAVLNTSEYISICDQDACLHGGCYCDVIRSYIAACIVLGGNTEQLHGWDDKICQRNICNLNSKEYNVGEIVVDNMYMQCICMDNNTLDCHNVTRQSSKPGLKFNKADYTGYASASGDPHIITFDGLDYDSHGVGVFTLCKPIHQTTFVITAKFNHGKYWEVKRVQVEAEETKNRPKIIVVFTIKSNHLITVESDWDPVHFTNNRFTGKGYEITRSKDYSYSGHTHPIMEMVIDDLGIKVDIKGINKLVGVHLIPGYKGLLSGLFGNWNGDPNDDPVLNKYKISNRRLILGSNMNHFVCSWKHGDDESIDTCIETTTPDHPCQGITLQKYKTAIAKCKDLKDNAGLAPCAKSWLGNYQLGRAIENCIHDVCSLGEARYCEPYYGYVDMCSSSPGVSGFNQSSLAPCAAH